MEVLIPLIAGQTQIMNVDKMPNFNNIIIWNKPFPLSYAFHNNVRIGLTNNLVVVIFKTD